MDDDTTEPATLRRYLITGEWIHLDHIDETSAARALRAWLETSAEPDEPTPKIREHGATASCFHAGATYRAHEVTT